MAILVAHVFLVRRIGVSSPPFGREAEEEWAEFRHEDHPGGHPFYPHFFVRELFMIMFFFAVMFFIIAFAPTIFLPGDANTPANLFETPAHIKPEWYFLAFYQMLRIIPSKFLGIMLQVLAVSVFVLWPFFDSRRQRNLFRRPLLLASFFALLALWAILSIWGKHS
jgi:ubiquinol-cytochrome c reductase cytochrome b subunit